MRIRNCKDRAVDIEEKSAARGTGSEDLRDTRLGALNHAVLYLIWGREVDLVGLRYAKSREPQEQK